MKVKIDLHGLKHEQVTDILIDSCFKYETPFIVITGHSSKMKTIVEDVVVKYFNLNVREMIGNKGCLIIED